MGFTGAYAAVVLGTQAFRHGDIQSSNYSRNPVRAPCCPNSPRTAVSARVVLPKSRNAALRSDGSADATQIGAWSITVRQTNVVWLAFVVGLSVLCEIQSELLKSANKRHDRHSARPRDEALEGEMTGDVPLAEVRSVGE